MRPLLCSLLIALLAGGCGTLSGPRVARINEVHLFGLPVTLNLDNRPGSDGFASRVYLVKAGRAKGVAIKNGNVEVLMFDGVVSVDEVFTKQPTQKWIFTPRELNSLREESSLGQGYRFILRWNEPPKRGHITVVARYVPEKGEPVYSSPSTITAATK
jgi:hypothetical protein